MLLEEAFTKNIVNHNIFDQASLLFLFLFLLTFEEALDHHESMRYYS
jgi:hypothetical protein